MLRYIPVILLILSGCGGSVPRSGTNEKPNIILILADDMGFSDIGCLGSEIRTPNIDNLAAEGLLFTQFYNAGRCCPSRASLLTGMYSHKTGIGHMVAPLDHPSYAGFLNDKCLTIAEALQSAGYSSYMTGKWHVGTEADHWPLQRGFEKFYGSNTSQGHYFKVYEGRKLLYDNQEVSTPEDWYATDAFTDSTVAFIRHHQSTKKDQPFFMYVAYTAPHWPLHALPEDVQKYEGRYNGGYDSVRRLRFEKMKALSLPVNTWAFSAPEEKVPAWSGDPEEARKMAVYAAMVDRMDQGIGRIIRAVDELGITENTMIVFLSDNGGSAEEIQRSEDDAVIGSSESYTSIGRPWANVNNTPFRKSKSWIHEGGISTPLIIKYPAMIKKPGRTNEVGHIIDLMPTFMDLADIRYPETVGERNLLPVDGKSLIPLIQSGKWDGHGALFWEHEGKKGVRQGDWKLVKSRDGSWELYNMATDRSEISDLSKVDPEKVDFLERLYEEWAIKNNVLPWKEVVKLQQKK